MNIKAFVLPYLLPSLQKAPFFDADSCNQSLARTLSSLDIFTIAFFKASVLVNISVIYVFLGSWNFGHPWQNLCTLCETVPKVYHSGKIIVIKGIFANFIWKKVRPFFFICSRNYVLEYPVCFQNVLMGQVGRVLLLFLSTVFSVIVISQRQGTENIA